MPHSHAVNGGDFVADVLVEHGVPFIFTLCGGHIAPVLVAAKRHGLRVVDVRDERNAVFAADAVARLTGIPGVAALTAGPGLTNAVTAVKNAQLAQSPIVVLGGATATVLRGRGALQDIDQIALMRPHVKWAAAVRAVREIVPVLEEAFVVARSDVPGPVFVEIPIDLLYPEELVRTMYLRKSSGHSHDLREALLSFYLNAHVRGVFSGADRVKLAQAQPSFFPHPLQSHVAKAAELVGHAERPILLIGSGAVMTPHDVRDLARAVAQMGIPTYLSGMARGLLGAACEHQLRHRRREALREADLVLLAGVPCDFRLDYGRQIGSGTTLISVSRSLVDLKKNRRPTLAVYADPGIFLQQLAEKLRGAARSKEAWLHALQERDRQRDDEIDSQAAIRTAYINPLHLCQEIEKAAPANALFVADGGDFVATAAYVLRPRSPLTWLDPGVFGTLGVGAGFALGAKLACPDSEVWLLYGDGSAGYSLIEWDTFRRHGIAVIAVVGNDACWRQIAREQIEMFHDDVGTPLRHTDYHLVGQALGGEGIALGDPAAIAEALSHARALAAAGKSVVVNALIGATDFRKGAISL